VSGLVSDLKLPTQVGYGAIGNWKLAPKVPDWIFPD
jgi:hypothetical protein